MSSLDLHALCRRTLRPFRDFFRPTPPYMPIRSEDQDCGMPVIAASSESDSHAGRVVSPNEQTDMTLGVPVEHVSRFLPNLYRPPAGGNSFSSGSNEMEGTPFEYTTRAQSLRYHRAVESALNTILRQPTELDEDEVHDDHTENAMPEQHHERPIPTWMPRQPDENALQRPIVNIVELITQCHRGRAFEDQLKRLVFFVEHIKDSDGNRDFDRFWEYVLHGARNRITEGRANTTAWKELTCAALHEWALENLG
ncbi:hypothetical protein CALVIDRAFT_218430 [Calocera viscosa TUFC12733]|uniref:Uncharacterized protein n=1 Tax=Calocera viscosa (strain TUFC12733) TaxID=1330018 RepID=A0A167RIR8_CALVF|nr:hypothetical protein CALVIDRAFT_218430 [Calocera viscosa TUFC12733]